MAERDPQETLSAESREIEPTPSEAAAVARSFEQVAGALEVADAGVEVGAIPLQDAEQQFGASLIGEMTGTLRFVAQRGQLIERILEGQIAILPALEDLITVSIELRRWFRIVSGVHQRRSKQVV